MGSRRGFLGLATVVAAMCCATTAALAAPGDLDRSFGSGGRLESNFGDAANAYALAVQPDGKIVAFGNSIQAKAGASFDNDNTFAIARYRPDGSRDTGFGDRGNGLSQIDINGNADFGFAVAIQPDGKLVLVGSSGGDLAVLRLTADGHALDSGFANAGIVRTTFSNAEQQSGHAVALLPDGKILVAGPAKIIDAPTDHLAHGSNAAVLVRYNPNGSLDTSFGSGGTVVTKAGGDTGANALAVQADGRIVTAGSSSGRFAVRRYDANGAPDSTFGAAGEATGGEGDLKAFAIQSDGKIVAGGDDDNAETSKLIRLNPDGSSDGSFGTGGEALVPKRISSLWGVRGIGIQRDGKIVEAGIDAYRFNPDGSRDKSFKGDPRGAFGNALAIQPNGRIVVAGSPIRGEASENEWFLARLLASGKRAILGISAAAKQAVARQKGVKINVVCPKRPCTVTISAQVTIGSGTLRKLPAKSFKLKRGAGKLTLRFPKKLVKEIATALKKHKFVFVYPRVTAKYKGGKKSKTPEIQATG